MSQNNSPGDQSIARCQPSGGAQRSLSIIFRKPSRYARSEAQDGKYQTTKHECIASGSTSALEDLAQF